MSLRINDIAPDFTTATSQGTLSFHKWIGDSYAIFFSHPKDFTPVCTTELGYVGKLKAKFAELNTKVIALSTDSVEEHHAWASDIEETQGYAADYPIIADTDLEISKLYNMLPADEVAEDGRTAANNATVRTVFIIGPDKKIKLTMTYPMSTGRNFDEIFRALQSIQVTEKYQVATPVNWQFGEDVIIPPTVSNEDAQQRYPDGFKTVKPYLRYVKQPS